MFRDKKNLNKTKTSIFMFFMFFLIFPKLSHAYNNSDYQRDTVVSTYNNQEPSSIPNNSFLDKYQTLLGAIIGSTLAALIAIISIWKTHKNQISLETDKIEISKYQTENKYITILYSIHSNLIGHEFLLKSLIAELNGILEDFNIKDRIAYDRPFTLIPIDLLKQCFLLILAYEYSNSIVIAHLVGYISFIDNLYNDVNFLPMKKLKEEINNKDDYKKRVQFYFSQILGRININVEMVEKIKSEIMKEIQKYGNRAVYNNRLQKENYGESIELLDLLIMYAPKVENTTIDWMTGIDDKMIIKWETNINDVDSPLNLLPNGKSDYNADLGVYYRVGSVLITLHNKSIYAVSKKKEAFPCNIKLYGSRIGVSAFVIENIFMSPDNIFNPDLITKYFKKKGCEIVLTKCGNENSFSCGSRLYDIIMKNKKKIYLLLDYSSGSAGFSGSIIILLHQPDEAFCQKRNLTIENNWKNNVT